MTTWSYWYGVGAGLLLGGVWTGTLWLALVGVSLIALSVVFGVLRRKWSSWFGGR